MASFLCCLFLGLSFLSIWVRRDPKIWMPLLFISLLAGMGGGNILPIGLLIILGWGYLWFIFTELKSWPRVVLFLFFVLASYLFIFRLASGFNPIAITPRFLIGPQKPMLVGLFPLALLVPVALTSQDWKKAFKGLGYGCIGIAIMAMLATAVGATHWQVKIPPHAWVVYLNNLILVAIPEEAFFRGFLQKELSRYWNNKYLALLFTSALFTLAHVYWSPNIMILAFVFIASLLYGWVYIQSGKIESAILTHFLLNFIHITFFTYHAV